MHHLIKIIIQITFLHKMYSIKPTYGCKKFILCIFLIKIIIQITFLHKMYSIKPAYGCNNIKIKKDPKLLLITTVVL